MGIEETFGPMNRYLQLLGHYLNNERPDDFVLSEEEISNFVKIAHKHSLSALTYQALKYIGIEQKELEQRYYASLKKSVLFEQERKELYGYLNDNQIDFLPLKGIILKDYYPDPYTREFADNDILFDPDKDRLVKKFFIDRHYKIEQFGKTNHDVYVKSPVLNFEMHRYLFGETVDSELIIKYFENYIKTSPIKEGFEHYLTPEDFYIYFTAHTYKHYHHSGCGLRTLVDYYVFLKKHELDFEYINQELNKSDIYKFSNLISKLAEIVFSGKELGPDDLEALYFICLSGTYGTLQNGVNRGVEKKGKFGYFMSRIFPPMSFYKSYYPWAYKTKVLIPIAWIMRFFRILFNNPKKATTELKMISKSKKQKKKKTKSDTHHK